MNPIDIGFLLVTGLIALYLCIHFYRGFMVNKKIYNIYYIIGFGVLLVAGLLLIFFSYDILASPFVIIVSTLIPLSLSLGLVTQYFPKQSKYYLAFVVLGFLAIAAGTLADLGTLGTIILASVHSVAGLTLFLMPIVLVIKKKVPAPFAMVSLGAALIGIGGIALGFLKTGRPLLFFTQEVIFLILAPLLFLMVASFAVGFIKANKLGGEKIAPAKKK